MAGQAPVLVLDDEVLAVPLEERLEELEARTDAAIEDAVAEAPFRRQ